MEIQVEKDTLGWIENEVLVAMSTDEMQQLALALSVALVHLGDQAERYPILSTLLDGLLEKQ